MTLQAPAPDALLLIVLLAAIVISAGLLAAHRHDAVRSHLTGREADAAHLLMNACMAWMLSPWYGPGAYTATTWLFGAMAVLFGALLLVGTLRPGTHWHRQRPVSGYHLCAAVAMLYATLIMPGSASMPGMPMSGPHDIHAMPGVGSPGIIAWVLGGVFALDALGTVIVVLFMPDAAVLASTASGADVRHAAGAPTGDTEGPRAATATRVAPTARRLLRISGFPHVVMDVAMVAMLLGSH
jgi:hypothetical protein